MPLDHGILNVPLAKRGNIDAQLDAYKAKQAAEAKAANKARIAKDREDKAAAKVSLAELIAAPGLLDGVAKKLGKTRKQIIAVLTDWSKWQPARVIKAKAEWMPA